MPSKIRKELPEIELIDDKSIGERITEARKYKGLTQQDLAGKLGIARRLLSEYETGRTRIFGEMITRIAIALQISTDSLHGLKKQEEPPEDKISLRYTKRIKEIRKLPEHKIRVILKLIDDIIKVNKE